MTAFAKTDISTVMRDWIVLPLIAGLRRQESMTITWEQVDLEQKRIVLPTNKSDRLLFNKKLPTPPDFQVSEEVEKATASLEHEHGEGGCHPQ